MYIEKKIVLKIYLARKKTVHVTNQSILLHHSGHKTDEPQNCKFNDSPPSLTVSLCATAWFVESLCPYFFAAVSL